MVDIKGLASSGQQPSDFEFHVGNTNSPDIWTL